MFFIVLPSISSFIELDKKLSKKHFLSLFQLFEPFQDI